ncbi:partner of Y14 and mago-like [Drosophila ficusphila]|uniref:partner of Y14 and mago-like n=1 Tax=Drosophila ficusphila TaxID=30025 RepID=UPI0007E651EC|nr:partner of Y14 and mago-like [Drosophila ficusphila]
MGSKIKTIEGKIIPASRRPDGSWRKARRIRDGYVPPEEVPLYKIRGKDGVQISMYPIITSEATEKQELQEPQIQSVMLPEVNTKVTQLSKAFGNTLKLDDAQDAVKN